MVRPPEILVQFASKWFASERLLTGVCLLLNHLLGQQPGSQSALQKEAGKVLSLSILPVQIQLRVDDQGYFQAVLPVNGESVHVHTQITMQWVDLLDSVGNTSMLSRKVVIQGDVNFAHTISMIFKELSWNPEHDLARVVGDVSAVWIMDFLTALGTNVKDVAQRFKNNLHEYVVYEKSWVPTSFEFDSFGSQTNQLRDQLGRLEKRLTKQEIRWSTVQGDYQ